MGAIVTQSLPGIAHGVCPFIVIDGQQRLTTMTLILAGIRDLLKRHNSTTNADKINNYLVNTSQENDNYYKIFYPYGGLDWDTYKWIVSKHNAASNNEYYSQMSNGLICKAFHFFKERLAAKIDGCSIDLDKLGNIIVSELLLVNITSDDSDNPYLIFESLNNKNLLLTQGDLIRNYILMKSSEISQKEEIYREWGLLEKNFIKRKTSFEPIVNKELLTQYFWAYLRKDGIPVTENQTYKYMMIKFDQSLDKHQLLKELNQFSNYYGKLSLYEKEPEEKIIKYFRHFLELDFRTCHVFLLNIYKLYDHSKISCEDFEEILCILESYFVRRFFTGISTNILGKVFDNLYKELLYNLNGNSIVATLKTTLTQYKDSKRFPQEKDFRTAIINKKIYNNGDARRIKFILDRLENSVKRDTKEKSFIPSRNLTIEHIMPQKLTEKWHESLENSSDTSCKWLHTLGNLTLTADNSRLSNRIFKEKKTMYKNSNLNLNKYFDNVDDWNADTIEKRANELADLAINIWPMP